MKFNGQKRRGGLGVAEALVSTDADKGERGFWKTPSEMLFPLSTRGSGGNRITRNQSRLSSCASFSAASSRRDFVREALAIRSGDHKAVRSLLKALVAAQTEPSSSSHSSAPTASAASAADASQIPRPTCAGWQLHLLVVRGELPRTRTKIQTTRASQYPFSRRTLRGNRSFLTGLSRVCHRPLLRLRHIQHKATKSIESDLLLDSSTHNGFKASTEKCANTTASSSVDISLSQMFRQTFTLSGSFGMCYKSSLLESRNIGICAESSEFSACGFLEAWEYLRVLIFG
uniref:Uncharacterized protein n=1 Tax=Chromera velia CCMP2878 TaxID=1169474 RepID=A0A0G4HJ05_9ALVE|eukprot:Cvel_28099.t1-p1 / transcript=Cvel_28099.t1 / gene=Cvel_28099 / organism=Chromera_velia_CCMP2878 / gene_product=hypothetical protein / transcript_product=hypothetical protein / location=Cvel_scaffold3618:2213-6598(-) / protein_length=286 / sequence_SO=supercontig / SO=protein_coding / is_pseudo=false